ncbi:MFS transporter [Nesterenkonia haasae]|uniref:MFS transporter n=1 Tax=Nesterenkonia haasae TaxID=2587813 RepID=UPI001390E6E4|nr:MFS transporter [Nesterenkonia haasae]NDK32431.1 MFS transporter [Nesterenkonia haasae]
MSERLATLGADESGLLSRRGMFWLTGAGLSLIAVCYGLARFAYGLFLPVFRAEFGLDAATAGAIASGAYASYCVAIVASTMMTPRYGGRALAVAAGGIASAGTLMIAAAPNALVLAVGVVLAGASTGLASPPLAHAVAHTVAATQRNRAQTVINAGTGLGVAIAGPIALLTLEHWRTAWLVFSILCALVTVWAAIAVPIASAQAGGDRGLRHVLPHPLLPAESGRLIAAAAMMGIASAAVWTFGRDILVTEGQLSEHASTIAWIVLGVFGIAGAVTGDLAGRFGIARSWTVIMLTMAAATALMALFPGNIPTAWMASAVFGAAYIGGTGLLLIWGTRAYVETPASGVGLAFLVIALGQAAAAPVIGAVAEVTSSKTAFITAALMAVIGCLIRPQVTVSTRGRL